MRIAAHDDRARLAVTVFDHDLMAHALSGVVERRYALGADPLAEHAMRVGDDGRRRGGGVVDEDADAVDVPHPLLPEGPHPRDDGVDDGVVHHDARHRDDDELAGARVAACGTRQDLLGERQSAHATTQSRRMRSSSSIESGPRSARVLMCFVIERSSCSPNSSPRSWARLPMACFPVRRCATWIVRSMPKSAGSRISYEFGF